MELVFAYHLMYICLVKAGSRGEGGGFPYRGGVGKYGSLNDGVNFSDSLQELPNFLCYSIVTRH